jgi:hypothetical protein
MSISSKNKRINKQQTKDKQMKKTLIAILSALLVVTVIQPSQADDQKVLAIIDTAINSDNFPQIIHEVCFTTVKSTIASRNMSCPNGELFMEGKGAASAPWPKSINNRTYHGDSMVKSALTVDPNIKIVFIRFNDVTSIGNSRGDVRALTAAIDWVSNNASKYSIDALSISQSSVSADNLSRCTKDTETINAVSLLNANNVPVFVATGNDRRKDVVGFPSCVDGVIGVGALATETQLEAATNQGPGLDMVARSGVKITKYNGAPTVAYGSSVATAVASASYVSTNSSKSFGEYLSSLAKILIGSSSYLRS